MLPFEIVFRGGIWKDHLPLVVSTEGGQEGCDKMVPFGATTTLL